MVPSIALGWLQDGFQLPGRGVSRGDPDAAGNVRVRHPGWSALAVADVIRGAMAEPHVRVARQHSFHIVRVQLL